MAQYSEKRPSLAVFLLEVQTGIDRRTRREQELFKERMRGISEV
jgi:hypothetical protein